MPENSLNVLKSALFTLNQIYMGTSTTHIVDPLAGNSIIAIYVDPTAVDGSAGYMTCRVESLIGATTSFVHSNFGSYTGTFKGGVKTGVTFKGTSPAQGYLVGVVGQLENDGVIGDGNSGGIYACAGLSQTAGAGTWGSDASWYGHWINVLSGVTSLPVASYLLNLTNNSAATVSDAIHIYGNSGLITNFASIETSTGTGFVKTITGNASHQVLGLKVLIDSVAYYIPLQNATS